MNLHKLTFGTPFPLGTLDTETLTKFRQMLQFISLFIKLENASKQKHERKGEQQKKATWSV